MPSQPTDTISRRQQETILWTNRKQFYLFIVIWHLLASYYLILYKLFFVKLFWLDIIIDSFIYFVWAATAWQLQPKFRSSSKKALEIATKLCSLKCQLQLWICQCFFKIVMEKNDRNYSNLFLTQNRPIIINVHAVQSCINLDQFI